MSGGPHVFACLVAIALCLLQPARSSAQAGASAATVDQRGGQDAMLLVTAEGESANRIGEPVFVTVILKNVSGADIRLKNFSVVIDASAAERFEAEQDCALQQRGELVLARGSSFEQTCRFAMKRDLGLLSWYRWQEVLLNTRIRLVAIAEVDPTGELRSYPSIALRAPEYSIFVGGFAGAMMLALFVLIEKVLRNPGTRQHWLRSAVVALVMGLRGGLMALIALLLSKTTQGASSPLNLTVTDFVGGLLVGLFSYPLATWISATLKLDEGLGGGAAKAAPPSINAETAQVADARPAAAPHPPAST